MYTRYTKGRELYFRRIGSDGQPGPETKLAGMGGHYQLSHYDGRRIMSVFNYHPGGDVDKRTNLYFVQSRDTGRHWMTIIGDTLQLPLTDIRTPALVRDYARDSLLVYLNDLTVDQYGRPVILAVISRDFRPGPAGDPRRWVVLHWKYGVWQEREICRSTEPGPQHWGTGGEMAEWVSGDEGLTWVRKRMLTASSTRNHAYARRPVNAHPGFEAFWADGHADTLSASRLYFSDRRGRVFMMPDRMIDVAEKPVRLKHRP
jgi:hypothetical protein